MLWRIRQFCQLLQKVDVDLRTAVDCVNNLQLLIKSWRVISNNDTYDEIYRKAIDMMSPEEISMTRIVKHQTMRSNVPAELTKNCNLRNLYYLFLDKVILQFDQQFSGHAEAVMRLSSLLPPNVVTANFCEVETAVNLFLPLLKEPLINVKAQFLSGRSVWCVTVCLSTMGQACLDDLCLIYIHNDISISTGAIIKKFAATSRKAKL